MTTPGYIQAGGDPHICTNNTVFSLGGGTDSHTPGYIQAGGDPHICTNSTVFFLGGGCAHTPQGICSLGVIHTSAQITLSSHWVGEQTHTPQAICSLGGDPHICTNNSLLPGWGMCSHTPGYMQSGGDPHICTNNTVFLLGGDLLTQIYRFFFFLNVYQNTKMIGCTCIHNWFILKLTGKNEPIVCCPLHVKLIWDQSSLGYWDILISI